MISGITISIYYEATVDSVVTGVTPSLLVKSWVVPYEVGTISIDYRGHAAVDDMKLLI